MAAGNNYYLITSLASLESLTSTPPMSNSAFLEQISDRRGAEELVRTLLLADDLMQRQALLAGEIEHTNPTILTAEQVSDEEPLPEYLTAPVESVPRRIAGDGLWAAYFRHAIAVARDRKCGFLEDWIGFEVAMRNALADARAKALELDPNEYLVEPDLGASINFASTLGEWSAATDPLTGLKVLDRARWDWIARNDRSYSFEDDEIAAYAAKLMLLHRWHGLAQAAEKRQD
ncbi:MAG: hypothetical protein QGH60_16265 [Phycisphaerae bacterium]|jgi:hypothetical protein|nr:hypothetical protein [Phycisphaerae bacterium]